MAPHELHNLVNPDDKEWIITRKHKRSLAGVSDDNKKLELRLGPPGDHEDKRQLLFEDPFKANNDQEKIWLATFQKQNLQEQPNSYFPYSLKACPVPPNSSAPNCCQKRTTARAPVVGWPPIRSCRKNLGSNSFSKTQLVSNYDDKSEKEVLKDHQGKTDQGKSELDHLFVKINMEGVPIGRKVDLKAFDSYEKLSYAIDALFRGLLAAQRDQTEDDHSKTVTNGEYTLVYEDNEGDRMLVGDVPWKMFVSTAKRLRVLRSVELSTLKLWLFSVNSSQILVEKTPL